MTDANYLLDKQNKIINVPFTIEQLIIKNSSQYPIYIKRGGLFPSSSNFDYLVQPNSDFASGSIGDKTVSLYSPALEFLNVAEIEVYSYKKTSPNNTIYNQNQSVPNINAYPITVKPTGSNGYLSRNFVALPTIKFDTFKPIYFSIDSTFIDSYGFLCYGDNVQTPSTLNYDLAPIGGFDTRLNDSLIKYTPSRVGFNEHFSLVTSSIGLNRTFTVNTFYADNDIRKKRLNRFGGFFFDGTQIASLSFDSYVEPPAFYISMSITPDFGSALSAYDVDILSLRLFDLYGHVLVNLVPAGTNFVGTLGTNIVLIPPTLFYVDNFSQINLRLANNIVTSDFVININIWGYPDDR